MNMKVHDRVSGKMPLHPQPLTGAKLGDFSGSFWTFQLYHGVIRTLYSLCCSFLPIKTSFWVVYYGRQAISGAAISVQGTVGVNGVWGIRTKAEHVEIKADSIWDGPVQLEPIG